MKRFACRDIIPGCSHVFTGADDQSVLDQVIAHAAVDHGLVKPPLALVELVVATTHTFTPARPRGHLRLVDAEPTDPSTNASSAAHGRTPDASARAQAVADVTNPPLVTGLRERIAPALPFQRRGEASGRVAAAIIEGPTDPPVAFPSRASDKYLHECVYYTGTDGFLAAVVPFIRDGVALGEPVMVAVAEPRLTALRAALGEDAQQVVLRDMAQLGGNPASIIPAWRDFIAGTDGRPIRGVGEPIWAGRRTVEIVESQLHEALLNIAVDPGTPLWLLCPYDRTALDEDVIAEAGRSHSGGHSERRSGDDPPHVDLATVGADDPATRDHHRSHARSLFAGELPEPATPSVTVHVKDGNDGEVATRVFDAATAAGLPTGRSARLAAAVGEVVDSGTRNSGREVSLRLWQDKAAIVCEVGDHGTITDLLVGRGPMLSAQSRDRGIRLANELCDLVQVRSNIAGTTVRMHSWL